MIKVSRQSISSIEVELILMSHDAVLKCVVVSKPNDEGLIKSHTYIIFFEEHKPSDALEKELEPHNAFRRLC